MKKNNENLILLKNIELDMIKADLNPYKLSLIMKKQPSTVYKFFERIKEGKKVSKKTIEKYRSVILNEIKL